MMDDTRRFTDDLDKATILGAVARGWCHEENAAKEMDGDLAGAIADEVEQVVAALRAQAEALTAERDAIAAVTVAKCADMIHHIAKGYEDGGDNAIACGLYLTEGNVRALSTDDPVKAAAEVLLAHTEAGKDTEIGPWLRALAGKGE